MSLPPLLFSSTPPFGILCAPPSSFSSSFSFLPSISTPSSKTDATPFLIAPSGPYLLTVVMHSPRLDVLSCLNHGFWWVTWDRACFVLAGFLFLQPLPTFPLPTALAFLRIAKGGGRRMGCYLDVFSLVPLSPASHLQSCTRFKSSPPRPAPKEDRHVV